MCAIHSGCVLRISRVYSVHTLPQFKSNVKPISAFFVEESGRQSRQVGCPTTWKRYSGAAIRKNPAAIDGTDHFRMLPEALQGVDLSV